MGAEKLAFIGAAILFAAISLGTLIAVVKEDGLRFKTFWAALSLVGVGGAVMVWRIPDGVFGFFGVALPVAWVEFSENSWRPELVRFLYPVGALAVIGRLIWHRKTRFVRETTG